MGETTFSYRVMTDGATGGPHYFSGELIDDGEGTHQIVDEETGESRSGVTIEETTVPGATSITRSFSSMAVDAGFEVTVTITATNYGLFGAVIETYPEELTYIDGSSTIGVEHNEMDRTLTFALLGETMFSYMLMAPSEAATYAFTGGELLDGQGVSHPTSGEPLVVGPTSSRSFPDGDSVVTGGSLMVTIDAMDYGLLGVVMETYPTRFEYVEDSSTIGVEHNEMDRTLTFALLGETTVSYRLTAPTVVGRSEPFDGKLIDDSQGMSEHPIGGHDSVVVRGSANVVNTCDTSRPSGVRRGGGGGGGSRCIPPADSDSYADPSADAGPGGDDSTDSHADNRADDSSADSCANA